jgi:hypothetical protein
MQAAIRQIFISHSGQDAEFARQLDATLLANGTKTFLAERDIRIGDVIPEKIYAGLENATDLVYIVSAHSIHSRWVQEELSIAKMREKGSRGFRIFPVLIDELELPASILHIKYADFRSWRVSQTYREKCLELLEAMNIAPRLIGRKELRWYASQADKLRDIGRLLSDCVGILRGGLDATQGGYARNAPKPHYAPTRYVFQDDEVVEALQKLCQLLNKSKALDTDRLRALHESTQESLSKGLDIEGNRTAYEDYLAISDFYKSLRKTRDMLEELRTEMEITMLSTVPMEARPAANKT